MRWAALIVFIFCAACGEEEEPPAYNFGDEGGGDIADGGAADDAGSFAFISSDGGEGGLEGFSSACPTDDDLVVAVLGGTLGEESVSQARIGGDGNHLATTRLEIVTIGYRLVLTWDETLTEGVSSQATGTLNFKGTGYCVVEAEVLRPTGTVRRELGEITFRISRVREGLDCEGGELETDLEGCFG